MKTSRLSGKKTGAMGTSRSSVASGTAVRMSGALSNSLSLVMVGACILMLLAISLSGCGGEAEAPRDDLEGEEAGSGMPQPGENTTGLPLTLPPGFSISIFAEGLRAPRVLAVDPAGNLLVSITRQGRVVALPDRDGNGISDETVAVAEGLNLPHGLAFLCEGDSCSLYVAETDGVRIFDYDPASLSASDRGRIIDLPGGGQHFTRTILIQENVEGGRILVSVGSSCNACIEQDERRAKILAAELDGSGLSTFASGLRNAVFMAFHPRNGALWVTEMGRDGLGDEVPPDEINIVEEGKDYGWPFCYGQNEPDRDFAATEEDCVGKEPSYIDLQAHSAPLGLTFVTEDTWPEEYRFDLLVAYHGSWDRTVPTGYKLMRLRLDEEGAYHGREDFIAGWLREDGEVLGRPADMLIHDGILYVSDDYLGVIYRIQPPQ